MGVSAFAQQAFAIDRLCAWAVESWENYPSPGNSLVVRNVYTAVNAGLNISVPLTGPGGIVGGTDGQAGDLAVCAIVTKQTRTVTIPATGAWYNFDDEYGYGSGSGDDMELWVTGEILDGDLPGPAVFTLDANADPVDAVAVVVILENPNSDLFPGSVDDWVDNTSQADGNALTINGFVPFVTANNLGGVFVGASSAAGTTPTITSTSGMPLLAQSSGGGLSVAAFGLVGMIDIPFPSGTAGLEQLPASSEPDLILGTSDISATWALAPTPDDNPGVDAGIDRIVKAEIAGVTTLVGISWTGHIVTSTDGYTWSDAGPAPTLTRATTTVPQWLEQPRFTIRSGGLKLRYIDSHFYILDGVHLWQNDTVDDLTAWTDLAPGLLSGNRDVFCPYDIAYDGTTWVVCGTGRDTTPGLVDYMDGGLHIVQDPTYGAVVLTLWSTSGPTGPWSNGCYDKTYNFFQFANYPYAGFYTAGSSTSFSPPNSYLTHFPLTSLAYGEGMFVAMGTSAGLLNQSSSLDGQTWNGVRGNPNAGSGGPDGAAADGIAISEVYDLCFVGDPLGTASQYWALAVYAASGSWQGLAIAGSGDSTLYQSEWTPAPTQGFTGLFGTGVDGAEGSLVISLALDPSFSFDWASSGETVNPPVVAILPYTGLGRAATGAPPILDNLTSGDVLTNGLCAVAFGGASTGATPEGYIGALIG